MGTIPSFLLFEMSVWPLFLKDAFADYSFGLILCLRVLKRQHSLLPSIVSDKSIVVWIVPLYAMCHYFLGCSKDFLFIFGFQPLIIPSCMVFFVLILLCVCRAFWICTCFSPFGKSGLLFLIVLFFLLYSFLSGNSVNSHYIFWYCPTGPKGSFFICNHFFSVFFWLANSYLFASNFTVFSPLSSFCS